MKIVKIDVNEQNKLACLSIVWYILFVETNKNKLGINDFKQHFWKDLNFYFDIIFEQFFFFLKKKIDSNCLNS